MERPCSCRGDRRGDADAQPARRGEDPAPELRPLRRPARAARARRAGLPLRLSFSLGMHLGHNPKHATLRRAEGDVPEEVAAVQNTRPRAEHDEQISLKMRHFRRFSSRSRIRPAGAPPVQFEREHADPDRNDQPTRAWKRVAGRCPGGSPARPPSRTRSGKPCCAVDGGPCGAADARSSGRGSPHAGAKPSVRRTCLGKLRSDVRRWNRPVRGCDRDRHLALGARLVRAELGVSDGRDGRLGVRLLRRERTRRGGRRRATAARLLRSPMSRWGGVPGGRSTVRARTPTFDLDEPRARSHRAEGVKLPGPDRGGAYAAEGSALVPAFTSSLGARSARDLERRSHSRLSGARASRRHSVLAHEDCTARGARVGFVDIEERRPTSPATTRRSAGCTGRSGSTRPQRKERNRRGGDGGPPWPALNGRIHATA